MDTISSPQTPPTGPGDERGAEPVPTPPAFPTVHLDGMADERIAAALASNLSRQSPFPMDAETSRLYARAWALARFFNSRAVTAYHLIAAADGAALTSMAAATGMQGNAPALVSGALARLIASTPAVDPAPADDDPVASLRPAPPLLIWTAAAIEVCERDGVGELQVRHLLEAAAAGSPSGNKILKYLGRSARSGGAPTRQDVESIAQTLSRFRNETRKTLGSLASSPSAGQPSGLAEDMSELKRRLGEQGASHSGHLAEVDRRQAARIDALLARLDQFVTDHGPASRAGTEGDPSELRSRIDGLAELAAGNMARLDRIAENTADVRRRLPRPLGLTSQIAGTTLAMALGAAAGLVLTRWDATRLLSLVGALGW